MPVLIQWKWQEKTKTYLVIFHFLDTLSERNLRMKNVLMSKGKYGDKEVVFESPQPKLTPLMTWAPSHLELGLLSEVLSYANIINGLNYEKKSEIRKWLEGWAYPIVKEKKQFIATITDIQLLEASQFRQLIYHTKEGIHQCFWLTPEYIEYLKTVLKRAQEPDDVKKELALNVAVNVFRLIEEI